MSKQVETVKPTADATAAAVFVVCDIMCDIAVSYATSAQCGRCPRLSSSIVVGKMLVLEARKLSTSTKAFPGSGDNGFVPAKVLGTWICK